MLYNKSSTSEGIMNAFLNIAIITIGLYIGTIEDIFAMNSQELLNKMEKICRLEQNIQTAEWLNSNLPKTERKIDTDFGFFNNCLKEIASIFSNSTSSNVNNMSSPGELLDSKIVSEHIFKLILNFVISMEEEVVNEMSKCVDITLLKSLFPFVVLDQLSFSQRSSLFTFILQVNKEKCLVPTNDYLLFRAINILSEEKTNKISQSIYKVMVDMIPESYLEGFELI